MTEAESITGWGRFPSCKALVHRPRSIDKAIALTNRIGAFIPRGQGRSYGDAGLSSQCVSTGNLDHIQAFNVKTGILRIEVGITLRTLLNFTLPRGWFLAVTPGTSLASLGGVIAADVHGKNHHGFGSFQNSVLDLSILLPAGDVITASRTENQSLFFATFGGMGLTGLILTATIQLRRIKGPNVLERNVLCSGISQLLDAVSSLDSEYSVAWVDFLSSGKRFGRSVLSLGEHIDSTISAFDRIPIKAPQAYPFFPARMLLRDFVVGLFNSSYFQTARLQSSTRVVAMSGYFYPLDGIADWNQWYGSNGLIQYQFVIPDSSCPDAIIEISELISRFKQRPYLCVLKQMGDENSSPLSFPLRGITVAMDFPRTYDIANELAFLDTLVHEAGGRIYLAKDALLTPAFFRQGYSKWEDFWQIRKEYDLSSSLQSLLSQRLEI